MDQELKALSAKVDKILEMQELILEKLGQGAIIPKEIPEKANVKLTKKEERQKRIEELKEHLTLSLTYGRTFRMKFNLASTPSVARIKTYLRTNDISAFDGLKRNKV